MVQSKHTPNKNDARVEIDNMTENEIQTKTNVIQNNDFSWNET